MADDPAAKRRKRLEAARALLGGQPSAGAAPPAVASAPPPQRAPAALAAPTAATAAIFKDDADDEVRRAEALKEERRRRLRALQGEMQSGIPRGVVGAATAASTPAAASAEEEEDPLDAFMRTQVVAQADKEAERAAAHQQVWQAQYGNKDVQVSDVLEPEHDVNKHCYVCKKWGHTKKDCPNKRCRYCGQEGHVADECEEKDRKIGAQFDQDKDRKRQKAYAAKKAKKREEWERQLREKTGVAGFEVLYEILGLPPRKLATKEAIRRAYRLQSLRYHPDKVAPDQAEDAAEKFLAVKTAYDLLLEGMETGGKGMQGAVYSGGDLEYRGAGAQPPAGVAAASGLPASFEAAASVVEANGDSAAAISTAAEAALPEDDAALFAEMESGEAVKRLQEMAEAHAALRAPADRDGDGDEDEERSGSGGEASRWLSGAEVLALVEGEPRVLAAVRSIADDPRALDGVLDDAVVMGILRSVLATRREAVVDAIS